MNGEAATVGRALPAVCSRGGQCPPYLKGLHT
jgi:hypothetical protein